MEDPNYEQTALWEEPKRRKGRPEYGRKLVNDNTCFADNLRKGRSIWSTQAESALLKEVLELIKYDPNYETITLGDILARYKRMHVAVRLEDGEQDVGYIPFKR